MSGVGQECEGRDFYVRRLWDWNGIARPKTMGPGPLSLFGRLCGGVPGTGTRPLGLSVPSPSPPTWAGDRFDCALTEFAPSYADQNERDYEALEAACRSGRIRAERC